MNTKLRNILLVAWSVLALIMNSGMNTWSYIKLFVQDMYPQYNETQLSLVFTLAIIAMGVGAVIGGYICSHTKAGISEIIGSLGSLVVYLVMSFIGTDSSIAIYIFYISFTLLGIFTGIISIPLVSDMCDTVNSNIGLITGIFSFGFNVGSLILGLIMDATILSSVELFPWLRYFAILQAIVIIAGALWLKKCAGSNTPSSNTDLESISDISVSKSHSPESSVAYTPGQMLSSAKFWLYFAWNICISGAGFMVIGSAAGIADYYGAPAIIGMVVCLFQAGGSLLIGYLNDAIGNKKTMFLNNGICIVAGIITLAGAYFNMTILILIGIFLIGIAFGGGSTLGAPVIRITFGEKYFSKNYGFNYISIIPAALIGPYLSGILQDAAPVGRQFDSCFIAQLIFGVVAMMAFFIFQKIKIKKQ